MVPRAWQLLTEERERGRGSACTRALPLRYAPGMRIIDCHTHVFPDGIAAAAIASLEAEGDVTAVYDGTVSGLLETMERAGVVASIIQPVATRPSQVRSINDWAAGVAGERIIGFGAMHPDLEDPAAEITRMHALGLRGFKMHSEYQSFCPDDPRLDPIWEAASGHGMIAFFHAGADIAFPTVRGTPKAFAGLLDRWPELTVVLAHLGGFREWEGVAALLVGRDVWLDTSYTLGHLPDDDFVDLVRAHGTERVLFGSDGPWTDPAIELSRLRTIGFTRHELAAILGENAERLLGKSGS